MRKRHVRSVAVWGCLLAVGCAGPQRFRTPAPAQDAGSLTAEPVFGSCAGHDDALKHLHVMEWVAKRTWSILGLPYERGDFKGPPNLDKDGIRRTGACAEIAGTVANAGVPLRNQLVVFEVEQRDAPIVLMLRSTDAFGEVLIELDLRAGTVRARSVTVSRSMIGGQSHSSPMPEESSNRVITETTFAPAPPGWQRLRIESRGEQITLSLGEHVAVPPQEWRTLVQFIDPAPAGGKFGVGSTGTVAVRNIEQHELISPSERDRRQACLHDMHTFCKGLDAEYDGDVRQANKVVAGPDGVRWTWPPTRATAVLRVQGPTIVGTVRAGLYGDDKLIDGVFPAVAVVATDGRVFRPDESKQATITADPAGMHMDLPLCDDSGRTATAHVQVDFTVLTVWWWTVTVEGIKPAHVQAFIGVAPAFAPKPDTAAWATQTPNIADGSVRPNGIHYHHNTRVGVFLKTIMPDVVAGTKVGTGEAAFSAAGDRLRFATLWLPAQPLNRIGFTSRMVHFIRYPEGPVQHWRRHPSHQEYPTNDDLARFAGNGCDAMVWHHTWVSNDYLDREGFLVNHPEMKRAMRKTHRLGMAAIGYIGIVPGRNALLRFEDAMDNYEKNWDLQDFTFYSVKGRWQEFLPWMTDYWCREYGLDGFYADGALAVASDRRLKQPLHPGEADLSLDELQHRLYYRIRKVLRRHGARFGLEQWGGSADMLVTGFYDCRMIGESFQEAEPEAYRDHYNALITGTPFKMYGMRESSQNPYNVAMAAVCMSDIQVCSGNGAWGDVADTAETWNRVRPLWDVLNTVDFDRLIEARPWYAQELISGEGFYAGNYTEPDRVLIFLANRETTPGVFGVKIDVDHLPRNPGQWHARYIYGREGDIGPLGQGRLDIELPSLRDGPIGIELVAR